MFSCSKDKSLNSSSFPQKWQLVKIRSTWTGEEETGDSLEFQEYYLFNPDSTFIKHRDYQEKSYEATGTFFKTEENGSTLFELDYDSVSPLVGSCYNDSTEVLALKSNDQMVNTWMACDGPGLEYERVK